MLRSFRWASLAVLTAGLAQTPLIAVQGPPQADPHAAEELAAEMLATTLDVDFDPDPSRA